MRRIFSGKFRCVCPGLKVATGQRSATQLLKLLCNGSNARSNTAIDGVDIFSIQRASFRNPRASVETDPEQSVIAWRFQPNGELYSDFLFVAVPN